MATDDDTRISVAFRPRGVGCRWCGVEQRYHFRRWHRMIGLHRWVKPTDQQRLARVMARAVRAKGCP
jgi:hypothetical protein